jgi:hypothetical protein
MEKWQGSRGSFTFKYKENITIEYIKPNPLKYGLEMTLQSELFLILKLINVISKQTSNREYPLN